ncbi:MAG: 6-pyruvoyl-tetrahydropterin synthase-related protein [Patescibacteria group bacterium]
MLDPYRMVFVNIIASLFLLGGVVFYKFVYPKKNINLLFLLILISLLPVISILRSGTYESGDLTIHTSFAISFYESLMDGNFVPRWSSQMIYGYGYPLFIFVYPLPYYLVSLIHFLGFTFIDSIKIILALSFISSGIGMYLFIKEELRNKFSAFFAALVYLFSPYHLVDLHFRVAIGEILAFAILPFCFLAIKKMSYSITPRWFYFSTISFSLLILSHQAISLISFPFIIVYYLYLWITKNNKKIKYIFFYIFTLVVGLLLSGFYWLPVVMESQYMNLLTKGNISFVPLGELFYSSWKWGFLFQGHKGELSFMVGYVQWFIIIFSIILFIKGKISLKEKKIYLISVISFFILIIMTQSVSSPIWMSVPILRGFEFSYRLLLLISFFISIIAGITMKNVNNRWLLIGLCIVTISITILNWGNRGTIPQLNDQAIKYEFPRNITKVGHSTTIWVNSDKFKSNNRLVPHIIVLQGEANISETFRNSVRHEYLINVISKNALIRENTLYFPGWKLYVDNNIYPINFQNPKYPGIILFDLSPGLHDIEISFEDTPIRKISKLISFVTGVFLVFYMIKNFPRGHNRRKFLKEQR